MKASVPTLAIIVLLAVIAINLFQSREDAAYARWLDHFDEVEQPLCAEGSDPAYYHPTCRFVP